MNIQKLPIGTKLIWDAPKPWDDYQKSNSLSTTRILYTMIICDKKDNDLGSKKQSHYSKNWIGKGNEFLRYPSATELEHYEWPII